MNRDLMIAAAVGRLKPLAQIADTMCVESPAGRRAAILPQKAVAIVRELKAQIQQEADIIDNLFPPPSAPTSRQSPAASSRITYNEIDERLWKK